MNSSFLTRMLKLKLELSQNFELLSFELTKFYRIFIYNKIKLHKIYNRLYSVSLT
jgi:hypothetical protein